MNYSRSISIGLTLVPLVAVIFTDGCSSDEPAVIIDDNPAPPTVTAPDDLSGIWEGTLARDASTYDVALVFQTPDGAAEGRVMGIAVHQVTEVPYILIDAGYQAVTNANLGYDYLVGQDGSQGTFMKFFEFDKNLVGAKRGSIKLDKSGNTLTGTMQLEDLGDFATSLDYSLQNARTTALADLIGSWSDASNGWDDTAIGTTLTVAANGTMTAQATGASTCAGTGPTTDVADYNIYLFGNPDQDNKTVITLTGCGTRVWPSGPSTVDAVYDGMATIVEDDNGTDILVLLMTETGTESVPALLPSMATYNEFIRN